MQDKNITEQTARLTGFIDKLRPELPKSHGETISEGIINNVQDVLKKHRDEILAMAHGAGGLAVLLSPLTVAIVTAVGCGAEGVVPETLAAALLSPVYGGLATGILSILQSFENTATLASLPVITAVGPATDLGGSQPTVAEEQCNSVTPQDDRLRAAEDGSDATAEKPFDGAGHADEGSEGGGGGQPNPDDSTSSIKTIAAAAAVVGGLTVLVPAAAVAVVGAAGFTAGGVAAGSLAAAVQSFVYGGYTMGVFSALQSFGATATMASPLVTTVAGAATAAGGRYLTRREPPPTGEAGEDTGATAEHADKGVPSSKNSTADSFGGERGEK